MAATDRRPPRGAILLAALALPGLAPEAARAENAPEHAMLAFKHLFYTDFQPGDRRITVNAPSLSAQVPLGEHWGVDASAVVDSVSGATPRYYTSMSGASHMDETRKAGDVKFSYFGERSGVSVGLSHSDEHDYTSNAASLELRLSTEDNNTTFNVGAAYSDDDIRPTNDIVDHETRRTTQAMIGVTQALSRADLVQLQLGYATGHGYYDDPYKLFDHRPDHRDQRTATVRWNHYFEYNPSALRTSYRWYSDSFGIRAHTVSAEWVQTLSDRLEWTPSIRYDTQNAARFYVDPPDSGPFPALADGQIASLDQRLAAFGGITVGQKLAWHVARRWTLDLKAEYSEQRASWRIGGPGSPDLDPFRYVAVQFGVTYRFR